jgi:hypothetical protein
MYLALWRLLPGPVWLRIAQLVLLAALVLTALVLWVFPVIDELTAPQEVTVGQ